MARPGDKYLADDAPATAGPRPGDKYLVDDPGTSALESGVRGAAQELTFGSADELAGGLESLFTSKTYRQARDESRAAYAKAEADNPLTYGAGQLAGGLASLAIPVGGAIGRAASTGSKVARAAAAGGVYGAGKSEAEDLRGLATDTAIGAGAGAAAFGATKLVGKAASKAKALATSGGPVADTIKRVVANRATAVAAGAALDLVGGGGGLTGALVGSLVPKAAEAVRKLLARGEVAAAKAVATAGPEWERTAAAAMAKAELAPAQAGAARAASAAPISPPSRYQLPTSTNRWDSDAAGALATPQLAPAETRAARAVATAQPEAPPRPTPLVARHPESGRFVSAKQAKKLGIEPEIPGQAEAAAPELAPPAPARKSLKIILGDRDVTPEELATVTSGATPPVASATDVNAELASIIKKNAPGAAAIPQEDRSTVNALVNVMSTTAKGDPALKHYPVAPDVAFKSYLGELPRAADGSATGRRRALSQLIVGVRRGDEPGELIYRARAAGVPDEAIMRAVGVEPVTRTAAETAAAKQLVAPAKAPARARRKPPSGGPTGAPAAPAAPFPPPAPVSAGPARTGKP